MKIYRFVLFILFFLSIKAYTQTSEDYFNSGFAKSQQLDFEAAIIDFTKAISLDATFAEAYNHRGIANRYLKN